jgi:hypothetical protein
MRTLIFWSEVGLSESEEAVARYERIKNEQNPVAFSALDVKLQSFAADVYEQYPDTAFGGLGFEAPPGSDPSAKHYSPEGLVVRLGDTMPNNTVSKLYGIGDSRGLTMYNPQSGYVLGVNDDLGVDIDT